MLQFSVEDVLDFVALKNRRGTDSPGAVCLVTSEAIADLVQDGSVAMAVWKEGMRLIKSDCEPAPLFVPDFTRRVHDATVVPAAAPGDQGAPRAAIVGILVTFSPYQAPPPSWKWHQVPQQPW